MKTVKRTGVPDDPNYILKDANLKERCNNLGKEMEERRKKNPEPELVNPPSELRIPAQQSEFVAPSDQKVKDFLAERENDEEEESEVKELAAQKILSRIMNKTSLYNEDELAIELVRLVKNITTKDVIDRMLEYMNCPLLNNPKWDNCGEQEKGNSEFCEGIEFMRCPAFGRYQAYEIIEKPKRKKVAPKKKN
jgi:hypothetical protein